MKSPGPTDRTKTAPADTTTPAEHPTRVGSALYPLLVDRVRDYAIFALDPTGHVLTWNRGAERIKGYSADEIIGKHFSIFYPPEEQRSGKTEMELEVAARDGQYEEEGWRVRKDRSRFWASVLITALRDESGVLQGFAKVTRDLTERRLAEERALTAAMRLAASDAANRAKSDFLATLSHELRTPLNAIGGYADLIDVGVAGPVTEAQRDYLGRIRGAQQLLLAIINDLLNYSRIEAGHVTYDIRPIPLDRLVERGLAMVAPQAVEKGIVVDHERCEGVVALADEQKAEQIILNLLSNAVKFTESGGRVTARCALVDGRSAIQVIDTGPGIPREKWDAVFEPFVQLGRSLAAPAQGTGLGLAISRDLARAMDGDLVLDSTPGEGSTFTLTLPLA